MPVRTQIQQFIDRRSIWIDVFTVIFSYAFILFAAWNDELIGLAPSPLTWFAEYALALGLAIEIVLRLIYARKRAWFFYPMVVVDTISVLTVIPGLIYVTFARIVRLIVSGARMLALIDRISRRRGNPYLILLVYPLVVPIAAALFYAVEKSASNAQVHNYFQSLVLMMSYSLTVGLASNHPVTATGKAIAGVMLLTGIMSVSIISNALTDRYSYVRSAEPPASHPDKAR
jgi:hypothetical protein